MQCKPGEPDRTQHCKNGGWYDSTLRKAPEHCVDGECLCTSDAVWCYGDPNMPATALLYECQAGSEKDSATDPNVGDCKPICANAGYDAGNSGCTDDHLQCCCRYKGGYLGQCAAKLQ